MVESEKRPSRRDDRERMLYQVRVPVVFDHLNCTLREQVNRQRVKLLQALGRGAAVVEVGGGEFGKFEMWFEVNDDPAPTGQRSAANTAIGVTEAALDEVGLAPTGDERGLCVVERQVVTTPLVARPERARL